EKEEGKDKDDFSFKSMLLLAIATSIDALAVGITFVAVPVTVLPASNLVNTIFGVLVIGVVTFLISAAGVRIGALFGARFKSGSEALGGTILIFIGLKILLEHLDKAGAMQDLGNVFGMLLPLVGTVVGSALIYLRIRRPGKVVSRLLMIFAGMIMLGVALRAVLSVSELNMPNGTLAVVLPLLIGIPAGILLQFLLDKLVPHLHQNTRLSEGLRNNLKPETKMVLAELLHHAPEGIALGAVYAASFLSEGMIAEIVPLILSIALALHNIPEAILLAAADREEGAGVHRSFFAGVLSGAPIPILGIITLILTVLFPPALPYVTCFAAGAILFTVFESIFPKL
ncbi:MAG: manganese efflux pump, partial [Lachnospiraceae bacterium]|nr:manganese efflux pump [Lachnospiraceae bacterium]